MARRQQARTDDGKLLQALRLGPALDAAHAFVGTAQEALVGEFDEARHAGLAIVEGIQIRLEGIGRQLQTAAVRGQKFRAQLRLRGLDARQHLAQVGQRQRMVIDIPEKGGGIVPADLASLGKAKANEKQQGLLRQAHIPASRIDKTQLAEGEKPV